MKDNHGFVQSGNIYTRNFDNVFSTVPQEYISDFLIGFNESSKKAPGAWVCYTAESINIEKMSLEKATQPSKTNRSAMNAQKKRGKRDYIVQYITDFEVGEAGESLVYKYECSLINKAIKQGKIDKSICVKWVSREDDFAGYDILSYDIDKQTEKYIEVKTTAGNKNTPFFVSENELSFSKNNSDNYCIYRVYGLKNNTSSIHFYVIEGNLEEQDNFELSKKDYLVKIKSQ